jgi:hypothetical protein
MLKKFTHNFTFQLHHKDTLQSILYTSLLFSYATALTTILQYTLLCSGRTFNVTCHKSTPRNIPEDDLACTAPYSRECS